MDKRGLGINQEPKAVVCLLEGMKKRIGIFLGTFDPPHLGHMECIQVLIGRQKLDRVCVVPINSFQKPSASSYAHRWKMIQLGFSKFPELLRFPLSIYDKFKDYSSLYTYVITIREFLGKDNQYFFLVSHEAFDNYFRRKLNVKEMEKYAKLILYTRPGYNIERKTLELAKDLSITSYRSKYEDLSSSRIRSLMSKNQPVTAFLNEQVYKYILCHDLYHPVTGVGC